MIDKVLTSEEYDPEPLALGRRVKEILDQLGAAYSVPAFSKRIGMSESTLYRCINGERNLKPSELTRIAAGLNITVSRLKMEDTRTKFAQMKVQAKHNINPPYTLQLALELLPNACGFTERFEIINCLGRVHYHLGELKQAQNLWSEALPLTEKLFLDYGDHLPLYMVLNNLILTCSKRKDYSTLSNLLTRMEARLEQLPPRMSGTIAYAQAMNAYQMGDLEELERCMNEHLDKYKLTGDPKLIATALHNTAYMLYVMKKYTSAQTAFETSITYMRETGLLAASELLFLSQKDYAKTLLKLGQKQQALTLIDEALAEIAAHKRPVTEAKLLLLRAAYMNRMEDAERVLHTTDAGTHLRKIACKLLMDNASKLGDAHSLMSYYKIGDNLESSPITQMEDLL